MNSIFRKTCFLSYKYLFIVVIILVLLSCKRKKGNNTDDVIISQTNKLEYESKLNWIGHWLGEDRREFLIRETGNEFEFRNQEIEVNLKFPQELIGNRESEAQADYVIKLINSPIPEYDVVWLEGGIYQIVATKIGDPYWGEKHLVDFSGNPIFNNGHKDFIINNPHYKNQMGGIFAGAFMEGYYYALWYNKEVANSIGITIKDFGMTYDDFLQYIKAVYSYNKRSNQKVAAIFESSDWIMTSILFQNLYISLINKKSPDEQMYKNALNKALQAFEELGKYKPLVSSYNKNRWYDTRQAPLNNQSLFYIHGTWMYSHWRGIDEEKMKKMVPVELPVFRKTNHYLGGYLSSFAVLKNAPNRDNAVKFMLFWCRPSIAEKWVRYTKNPTGLKGNIASSEIGGDVFEVFQSTISEKYGSNVSFSQDASYLGGISTPDNSELNTIIIELLDGKITADEAYSQLVKQ